MLRVLVVDRDGRHQRVEGDGAGMVGHHQGTTGRRDVLDAAHLDPEPVLVERAQQGEQYRLGELGVEAEVVDGVVPREPGASELEQAGQALPEPARDLVDVQAAEEVSEVAPGAESQHVGQGARVTAQGLDQAGGERLGGRLDHRRQLGQLPEQAHHHLFDHRRSSARVVGRRRGLGGGAALRVPHRRMRPRSPGGATRRRRLAVHPRLVVDGDRDQPLPTWGTPRSSRTPDPHLCRHRVGLRRSGNPHRSWNLLGR